MTRVSSGSGLTGSVQLRSHPLGCVCARCHAQEAKLRHRASDASSAEKAASLHEANKGSALNPVDPLKSTPTVGEVADTQRQEGTTAAAQAPAEGPRNPYQDAGPAPGSQLSVKA